MQETGIRRELEAGHKSAGASLRPPVDWRSINWKQVNRNVRRLQRRIVQAQQQGQKRKIRALQFILTRSYSGRCLAVRRVTENAGKRTPGVDGHLLDTPVKKARAVEQLSAEDYRPQALRRILIPKDNDPRKMKMRPLGIPTVVDRLIQQALHQVLSPIFEPGFSESSYGFRPGRSAHQAVRQARAYVAEGRRWVADLDLEKFLDQAQATLPDLATMEEAKNQNERTDQTGTGEPARLEKRQ